ncbi:hypothetical protein O7635_22245 [Asanoa sp. WMMD1127]|uniref:hypothetical protein n=1 Tax=Asanoa sp. WMMD1127 TaxID=3016107 RepID=UPI002416618D|nr:hypothetical protein [Asanoa sp. WMMD1127]MDG4824579.1 hypothetical protein [Asanoa sp. WMMD1127]
MPDDKRAAHRALVDRLLTGDGRTSPDQRARAFANDGLPAPLATLVDTVADRPAAADFAAARAAGLTEDQIFELVVCAAVGQATRQYEAGLAALAEATRGPDDAA